MWIGCLALWALVAAAGGALLALDVAVGYALLWAATAAPALWLGAGRDAGAARPALPFLVLALSLAAVRAASGIARAAVVAVLEGEVSRNGVGWAPLHDGSRGVEALALAGVTTAGLRRAGVPPARAAGLAVALELASALYARAAAPVHDALEGALGWVAADPALPADREFAAWDGGPAAIDVHGALWVGDRQPAAGRFVAVRDGACALRDDGTFWATGTAGHRDAGGVVEVVCTDRAVWTRDADGTVRAGLGPPPVARARDLDAAGVPCWVDAAGALGCAAPLALPAGGPWVEVAVGSPEGPVCGRDAAGVVACAGDVGCWEAAAPGPFEAISASRAEACGRRPNGAWACWGGPGRPPVPDGARAIAHDRWGRRAVLDARGRPVTQDLPGWDGCR